MSLCLSKIPAPALNEALLFKETRYNRIYKDILVEGRCRFFDKQTRHTPLSLLPNYAQGAQIDIVAKILQMNTADNFTLLRSNPSVIDG